MPDSTKTNAQLIEELNVLRARVKELDHAQAERKQAEERLRLFRHAVESLVDGMAMGHFDGRIIYVNEAFARMFGYSREELTEKEIPSLYAEDQLPKLEAALKTTREGGWMGELIGRKKNGELFPLAISASRVTDDEGNVVAHMASHRDITETSRAEAQARQHQAELAHISRLSTMGELAAGLAHELNQPLAAIINYTRGALRRIRSGSVTFDDLIRPIEQSAEQATRAGQIIRRVRDFVSRKEPRRSTADVGELIEGALGLVEHAAREHDVTVALELPEALPLVIADRVQIQQVVINLVLNAIDALHDSDADDRRIRVCAAGTDHDGIEIAVRDHGPGVPADLTERIFEPFFTTRAEGMGMGLAICRSLVANHGGRLWMTPNRPRGVTFHFTLPEQP